ncbi:aminotransferase class I/II-fold pyridoxal phosphate-dependent enzyme [Virgibacillus sp. NKC19-3]|uniref:PLP-dependent aspartate aminotransferase family protein n=1 Tax=Virgibacillus saliphilus TaxID=2831674 RepID=UPI001C9ABEBF|nr:PLP-dependent aspartate aminotransferase family protein [Virgibacillus sp. NKC19-3]MBY7144855.1 aminotransferase class I/II-fold pyridoxal phosphate-dependent enzyme [Virgibacillus sp. NKC19-3]
MSNFPFHNPETILLHGGQEPDPATGSRAMPIHQTTSYVFRDTEHAQNVFGLAEPGNIYTRITNPTVDAFEQRMASLEDGSGAVATSSGMAAITFSILNLAGSGDEIVADSNLYGGTYNLFAHTLPRYGIDVKFVDGTDPEAIRSAITTKTKAVFAEIITNPSLNIFDVETVGAIAHENNIPLIIDNTFATPYGTKPLTWGADIVVHSATKWIGGHGTTIGGVVIDGGRFDWGNGHFPGFTEPDESYNGLRYVDLGPAAYVTKLRVQLLRDIGASLSPQSAFLFLQGLETLHLRVERHNKNAEEVAAYLQKHPAVEWVNFPGLEDHPSHQLAKKYLANGFGSIITFGIKGGRDAGRKLIDNVTLWSHVANVGDAKSLIIHPASTTHQQLSAQDLEKSGTTEELVRLSIGIENPKDILVDLDQAIAKAVDQRPLFETTEDDAITWLLSSPFDRKDGAIRKKVIAAVTSADNTLDKDEKQLAALGFSIIPINEEAKLEDIADEVDAVWVNNQQLPQSTIEQLINKQGKILWVEEPDKHDQTVENARAAGITVITGKNPYEEALRLRDNHRIADPWKV